jgi:transcriptional repressor NrdR
VNSRSQKRLNSVWRRRICDKCGSVFTTTESADYSLLLVIKGSDGRLRPFSRDKLFLSLLKSCEHRKNTVNDAAAITNTVIGTLIKAKSINITSDTIKNVSTVALNRFDRVASTHYRAFHP